MMTFQKQFCSLVQETFNSLLEFYSSMPSESSSLKRLLLLSSSGNDRQTGNGALQGTSNGSSSNLFLLFIVQTFQRFSTGITKAILHSQLEMDLIASATFNPTADGGRGTGATGSDFLDLKEYDVLGEVEPVSPNGKGDTLVFSLAKRIHAEAMLESGAVQGDDATGRPLFCKLIIHKRQVHFVNAFRPFFNVPRRIRSEQVKLIPMFRGFGDSEASLLEQGKLALATEKLAFVLPGLSDASFKADDFRFLVSVFLLEFYNYQSSNNHNIDPVDLESGVISGMLVKILKKGKNEILCLDWLGVTWKWNLNESDCSCLWVPWFFNTGDVVAIYRPVMHWSSHEFNLSGQSVFLVMPDDSSVELSAELSNLLRDEFCPFAVGLPVQPVAWCQMPITTQSSPILGTWISPVEQNALSSSSNLPIITPIDQLESRLESAAELFFQAGGLDSLEGINICAWILEISGNHPVPPSSSSSTDKSTPSNASFTNRHVLRVTDGSGTICDITVWHDEEGFNQFSEYLPGSLLLFRNLLVAKPSIPKAAQSYEDDDEDQLSFDEDDFRELLSQGGEEVKTEKISSLYISASPMLDSSIWNVGRMVGLLSSASPSDPKQPEDDRITSVPHLTYETSLEILSKPSPPPPQPQVSNSVKHFLIAFKMVKVLQVQRILLHRKCQAILEVASISESGSSSASCRLCQNHGQIVKVIAPSDIITSVQAIILVTDVNATMPKSASSHLVLLPHYIVQEYCSWLTTSTTHDVLDPINQHSDDKLCQLVQDSLISEDRPNPGCYQAFVTQLGSDSLRVDCLIPLYEK